MLQGKDVAGFNERVNAVDSLEDVQVDYADLEIKVPQHECACCESTTCVKGICPVCGCGECM